MENNKTAYDSLKTQGEKNVINDLGKRAFKSPFPKSEVLRNFPVYTPRQTIARFLNRYEMFKNILNVHGTIFEFGVFRGGGAFSWLHFSSILEPNNTNRRIYAFDTFEGFPELSEEDDSNYQKGDLNETSFDELYEMNLLHQKNIPMAHIQRMNFVKGNIIETLPEFLKENPHVIAALVYVDVDIYKPTKIILENLLQRIPKGGILAFDELNDEGAKGETIALLESCNINELNIQRNYFDSNPCYIKM